MAENEEKKVEPTNDARREFETYLKKWAVMKVHNGEERFKNGVDVGCGTKRIDERILSIDAQIDWQYAHAQLVWDCRDLDLFGDNKLDFIFSSHVLEDFENIEGVFFNWWRKLKRDGLMLLLLPDIQGGRYPGAGKPGSNPSHKTNVGKAYMHSMLGHLKNANRIDYRI